MSRAPRHETTDVAPRYVALSGVGLAVTLAMIGLGLWGFLAIFHHRHVPAVPPTPLERAERIPPPPRLQANPAEDLAELNSEAQTRLHTTGWIDRDAGIVRIPIEDAMRVLAQRGWPSREGSP